MSTPWGSFQGRTPQLQPQPPLGQRDTHNNPSNASLPAPPVSGMRYAPIAPFGGFDGQDKSPEKRRNNRAWYVTPHCYSSLPFDNLPR